VNIPHRGDWGEGVRTLKEEEATPAESGADGRPLHRSRMGSVRLGRPDHESVAGDRALRLSRLLEHRLECEEIVDRER
jgi:hypothetical protein